MRLFVALDVPPQVRRALIAACAPLRMRLPRARWVGEQNMHVTAKFIGEHHDPGALLVALEAVAGRFEPIEVKVEGGGTFGSGRRVLWAGVHGPLGPLFGDVEEHLAAAGVAPAERPQVPHLTLARCPDGAPRSIVPALAALPAMPSFLADALTLYRTDSRQGGAPVYEAVGRVALGRSCA